MSESRPTRPIPQQDYELFQMQVEADLRQAKLDKWVAPPLRRDLRPRHRRLPQLRFRPQLVGRNHGQRAVNPNALPELRGMSNPDKKTGTPKRIDAWLLLLGSLGGLLVLGTVFSGNRSFEEAALGSMTVVHESAGPNGENTHCQRIKEEDHTAGIAFAASNKRNILILGNSQTHSINQKKAGETVYPELIQQQLDSIGVLTHSMPNANLQEFLVSHAWWTQHTPLTAWWFPPSWMT